MQSYKSGDSQFGAIWLRLKNELDAIASREELAYLINERIKDHFPVSHALAIMFEGEDGYRRYILNQLPAFREMPVPRFEGRGGDVIIELARRMESPAMYDLVELSMQVTLPSYLSANIHAGARQIVLAKISGLPPAGTIILFLDPTRPCDPQMEGDLKTLAQVLADTTGRLYAPESPANEIKYRLLINFSHRLATESSKEAFKMALQDICLKGFGRKEFIIWAPSVDKTGFNAVAENIIAEGRSKSAHEYAIAKLKKVLVKQIKKRERETLKFSMNAFSDELSGLSTCDLVEWMGAGEVFHFPLAMDTQLTGYLWIFAEKHDQDFGSAVASLVTLGWGKWASAGDIDDIAKSRQEGKRILNKKDDFPLNGSLSRETKNISEQLSKVAPTDLTILLLGETGTGKNVLANAIHRQSGRWQMPFVTVNFAAISPEMMESELFGHEAGSFTGALERRTGKFEQAQGGTLFLDEIGEIPFPLQAKLLRAIQEKEIERIGGNSPIPVNIRIIAASNRDIRSEMQHGRFRKDLFFRLNGFLVRIPALRERRADIPALISHFLEKFGRMHAKPQPRLSKETLSALASHDWPGNVRQLEYLMEKIVILSSERLVHEAIRSELQTTSKPSDEVKTLAEVERDHILSVLAKASGKISGPGGAAELLKMPPTTLKSKIKKLGIRKRFYQ